LFATVDTFADLVGRTDREPVRLRGATAEEIARMDEAFAWLRILQGDELRSLAAWAACAGSVRLMLARRGLPRATFYRRVVAGSDRIAARLNTREVR
jgi:transcriptional regulator of acetoin/glycerol metabolism